MMAQRMLQQAAGEAVMHAFGGGMRLERLGEDSVVHKESLQEGAQLRMRDAADVVQQLIIHFTFQYHNNASWDNAQVCMPHKSG